MLDLDEDFNVKALADKLREKKIMYDVVTLSRKNIVNGLKSGKYSTFVLFGIGSGGKDGAFFHPEVRWNVQFWVSHGGRFLIHGEGEGDNGVIGICRGWFSKEWRMTGDFYRRTEHQSRIDTCTVIPNCRKKSLASDHVCFPMFRRAKKCMLLWKEPLPFHSSQCPAFMGPQLNQTRLLSLWL